jgi:hypothetical protein
MCYILSIMLKGLAILVLGLAVIPLQTHAKANETNQAAKSKEQSSPAPGIAQQQDNRQNLQARASEPVNADVRVISTPKKDDYDIAGFWATMTLVLVGIGGILVASFTLRKIKIQAEEMTLQRVAMEETLTAIKRQADMMENAERARMTIIVSRLGNFSFAFRAKNIGKTSAKVTYARGFSAFVCRGESLPEIPTYVSNAPIGHEPVQWVGPGDDVELVRRQDDGKCVPMLIADLSEQSTRANIGSHGHSLWVYGRILYLDGISPIERDFRFCYGMMVDVKEEGTLCYSGGPLAYRLEST